MAVFVAAFGITVEGNWNKNIIKNMNQITVISIKSFFASHLKEEIELWFQPVQGDN